MYRGVITVDFYTLYRMALIQSPIEMKDVRNAILYLWLLLELCLRIQEQVLMNGLLCSE